MTVNHIALARKYRPKKFSEIVGQEVATTVLHNTIKSSKIHHAYLLTGTRGIGKTTIARIIAKALNCNSPISSNNYQEPCCECQSCLAIDNGSLIDVIEIDAASNTGVDNIREVIDNSQYSPSASKYKIYIIDEVHMLSKSAFNAMLKTLEEPPAHVVFILATTELHKIPITILSRCLQIKLRNLHVNEITEHLKNILSNENVKYETAALELIAKFANGSMRDALSLLDQAIAYTNGNVNEQSINLMLGNTDEQTIFTIIDCIIKNDSQQLVQLCQKIRNDGYDMEICLENLAQAMQQIAITQLTGNTTNVNITNYAKNIGVNSVQLYFEICNLGLSQLKQVNDKYSVFIMTLLRMLAFNLATNQQQNLIITNSNIISQVDNLEQSDNMAPTPIAKLEETVTTISISSKDESSTPPPPKNLFDGNWISLVKQLKNILTHSAPFLDNSQLIEFSNKTLQIKIDKRYQSSFTQHTHQELVSALNNYFDDDISLCYVFYDDLQDTLKVINQKDQELKRHNAVESINNDPKLLDMVEQFSATILPDAIKPKPSIE